MTEHHASSARMTIWGKCRSSPEPSAATWKGRPIRETLRKLRRVTPTLPNQLLVPDMTMSCAIAKFIP